jgi:RNA polymerase sigma-70 factor, ECF subfamily
MDTISAARSPLPVSQWGEMPTTVQELQLLERVRSGDREAAEELVLATYRPIFAALARLCGGDRELAADLTQETFRRAWQNLSGFDGRSRASTWLYRIAYNAFLNHVRRPVRAVSIDEEAAGPIADPAPDIEQRLAAAESLRLLRDAVLALPDGLRFIVTARYWAELSVRDIAREQGVSTVAIRKRLRRALACLEEALEKQS